MEPVLTVKDDPDLLGGMVVQVGDQVVDTSVRTRLDTLRTLLMTRHQLCPSKLSPTKSLSVLTRQIGDFDGQADGPRGRPGARSRRRHRPLLRPVRRHGRRNGRLPRRPGVKGLAFNLEENSVAVIILGDYLKVARGDGGPHDRRAALACRSARR